VSSAVTSTKTSQMRLRRPASGGRGGETGTPLGPPVRQAHREAHPADIRQPALRRSGRHYRFFQPFEYDCYQQLTGHLGLIDAFRHLHPDRVEHSWIGRTGDGYRYDHALAGTALASRIDACAYLHQPRELHLSDHAALSLCLRIQAPALVGSDPATAATAPTLRPGARVLLLDPADRVLLLHATDPTAHTRHWWELPGGGLQPGETTTAACRRELAEETGILLDDIGPCIRVRESRFTYNGR
jgi:hypothetical protein